MSTADDLLRALKTWHRMPAGQVLQRLDVSRATLMRAVHALGSQVVVRGRARKTAYAARRALRGSLQNLPLYRIDRAGQAHELAPLQLLYPAGCAIDDVNQLGWPLDADMHDGNLSFRSGLELAPVYDMLPMAYAPARGMELPATDFVVPLPLPAERPAWLLAAQAAELFWNTASIDLRISPDFRQVCKVNAEAVHQALRKMPEF